VISVFGALLGGVGAFLSSQQQTRRQVELREKADEVAESQRELRKKSDEIAALYQTLAESQRELREKADVQAEAQTQLRLKSEEIAELNRHIANAQIELRKRSDEVAELNRTIAASVTGGDSYCYLTLSHLGPNNAIIVIVHQGNYPLYDVSIRMVDLDKYEEVSRKFPNSTFESLKLSETNIPVGNLSPGQARLMHSMQTSTADKFRHNIFISARNGMFTELLRFAKVEGVWKSAMNSELTP
jgi:hypothetical protein